MLFYLDKKIYLVTSSSYYRIIDFATNVCKIFVVVARDKKLSEHALSFINEAKPYLIRSNKQNEWPGTFSVTPRQVYYFTLNKNSCELIKKYSHDWSDSNEPNLLEDLSFLKGDESEWLVSTSHEQDIYLRNYTNEDYLTISTILKDEQLYKHSE